MIAEWQKVTEWAQDEGARVEEAYSARSFWFHQLREQEDQDKDFKSRPIIFSRWGLRDARMDPFGAEAFCWDGGPVEGNATRLKGTTQVEEEATLLGEEALDQVPNDTFYNGFLARFWPGRVSLEYSILITAQMAGLQTADCLLP
ncbi:hypothetical protein NM208_g14891 [Fusarium decemcellulare]|uniref:Uncharacterized protein n=1 Tax=Fusarium decemcellulare TaxID=57161 RepID=A0ACC1REP8_9HYPO|nr:hypothetical protein NM208_g14891 [Fusarium decemcellulare]